MSETAGMQNTGRRRLAIVGTGVSGLVAAHRLQHDYDLTLFEAGSYVGGHTNTVDVVWDGEDYAIDTGFIVFNDWTYPNFIALLHELGVGSLESSMSFSVKNPGSGLEYCGTSLGTIFAQRRNIFRPSFLWMLREIMRFNREAPKLLDLTSDPTLGAYLEAQRYSPSFVQNYIIPMGAAIWSASPASMLEIPARFFIRFFANHGMLSVDNRPAWRVVQGGSRSYVDALIQPFRNRIRLNTPVARVHRVNNSIAVELSSGDREQFDAVVLATHSDTALRMPAKPTAAESEVLSAIRYQENEAVLHVDASALPRQQRAWAAWNYHVPTTVRDRVAVTYNMNILQNLRTAHGEEPPVQFCVTLNDDRGIAADKVIRRITYHHPIFSPAAVAAQQRHIEVSGAAGVYYCGAYWGNGFHEDGVNSGLRVAKQLMIPSVPVAT